MSEIKDINWKLHQSIKDKYKRKAFDEITEEEMDYLKELKNDMYNLFPTIPKKFKDEILKFSLRLQEFMERLNLWNQRKKRK